MVVSGLNRDGLQIRRRPYGNFAGAKQRRSIRVKSSQLGRCGSERTKTEREKESESKIRERSVENVIGNDLRGQRSAERGYRTGEECL